MHDNVRCRSVAMDNTHTLLDEQALASLLGLSVSTLRNWRVMRRGPAYIKLGKRCVRYRQADIEQFLAEGERGARDGAP